MGRASLIVKSKFSKILDKAEDPGETLDYSYEKQLESLQNVKRGIADVVTAKKRLQMQTAQLEQSVVTLDGQARQAVAADRPDLARAALERKSGVQQQLQGLDVQIQQLEAQQEKLIAAQKQLQSKIEAFRTEKEVIKAQYSAAQAQVKIGEAASGIGEHMADLGLAMQRAQDKTTQMQARAGAIDELMESGALDDMTTDQTDLDKQLAQISSQSQVDTELAAMQAELRQACRQAGAGRRRRCAGRRHPGCRARRDEARGAGVMIVRVMGDGQFDVPDDLHQQLHDVDALATKAVESGDEEELRRRRSSRNSPGSSPRPASDLDDDHLSASDLIIPPHDLSLDEARELFSGEGLIPDSFRV